MSYFVILLAVTFFVITGAASGILLASIITKRGNSAKAGSFQGESSWKIDE